MGNRKQLIKDMWLEYVVAKQYGGASLELLIDYTDCPGWFYAEELGFKPSSPYDHHSIEDTLAHLPKINRENLKWIAEHGLSA